MYAACRDTFGHKLFIAPQILGDGEVGSCARSRVFCFASPHAAKFGWQNKTARELYVSFVCVNCFWSMRLFGMEFCLSCATLVHALFRISTEQLSRTNLPARKWAGVLVVPLHLDRLRLVQSVALPKVEGAA